MIRIDDHPIWQGSNIFGKVNPFKRRLHILRFKLARSYAKLIPREKIVGITGTVGKTSATIACKAVLEELGPIITTDETSKKTTNLDPVFNLPQTLLRYTPKVKNVILEMGIEYPGEMDLWLSLVGPSIGIITAVDYQHNEFLGSVEKTAEEKGKLIEQLRKGETAILNWDDQNCRKLAAKTEADVVFFGTDAKNCHVWASKIRIENFRVIFELNYGVERVEVATNFVGKHQIYPLLAAAALGLVKGVRMTKIKKALELVSPAEHRLQVIQGFNQSIILDDTYNAAPISVFEALESLNYVPARRRILVLGEVKELGSFSEKIHRQIAQKIFKDKVDIVLLGKGDTKFVADELINLGFPEERMEADLQNPQIVSKLLKILSTGDLVLIKGSRGVRLDEVVKKISKTSN